MRKKLGKLGVGKKFSFIGRIRYFKGNNGKLSVVIEQVRYKKKLITDHVWLMNRGLSFKRAGANAKDIVSFKATVRMYAKIKSKNPLQFEIDYGLEDPQEIYVVKKEEKKMNNVKQKNIIYKTNTIRKEIEFDFENKQIWLTQKDIATITQLDKSTISRNIKKIENAGNIDLQTSKMQQPQNGKEVNYYCLDYLFILRENIKSKPLNDFLDWCEMIFRTNDFENYKIVRFTQDNLSLEVRFTNNYEAAWLNQDEIAELYNVTRENITIHIRNIFSQSELEKVSVSKFFLHTGTDNKSYEVEYFNLDMILAIGYRVNSKQGIAFRKWANKILKDYLIKGYAINEKRLASLGKTIEIQNKMLSLTMDVDYQELKSVIKEYTSALDLLDDYDHQTLSQPKGSETIYRMTYEDAKEIISSMSYNQNSTIFGVEKEEGKLDGILAAVYQNVFGQEVYPSLENKAAHLLYFLVKDHPFYDGCKRIAATLFLEFLNKNHALFRKGKQTISNDALAAITLLTAVSNPDEIETIVSVIVNILVSN